MGLVVVALLAALAVGRATGGRLERLGHLRLSRRRLVVLAVVVQLAGAVVGGPAQAAGLALAAALLTAFLLANRGVRGTGLVALGLAANGLVVALNGAMPVSFDAAARAGAPVRDVATGADPRHEVLTPSTRLHLLADVVPVPLPLRAEVVSPGDVLVAAGVAQLVVVGMRPAARRRRHRLPVPAA